MKPINHDHSLELNLENGPILFTVRVSKTPEDLRTYRGIKDSREMSICKWNFLGGHSTPTLCLENHKSLISTKVLGNVLRHPWFSLWTASDPPYQSLYCKLINLVFDLIKICRHLFG